MRKLPRVTLKKRRALPFFSRHPWVFAGAVATVTGDPEPGSEVAVVSSKNEFIARGLFNPNSNIRVRLYCWEESRPLNTDFWSERIDRAVELRQRTFGEATGSNACRLIYSEADGLSGLIVDRYGDWLLLQFTSLALSTHSGQIVRLLKEKLKPAGIWLRTEKGIREAEGLTLSDGTLDGGEPPRPLFIDEHAIRYGVDIVEGQKTGFYLDQRNNRAALARYVGGHRVLDLFCYTGGFGLAAVKLGNAKSVHAVDSSEPALRLARANAELNEVSRSIIFEKSKALDALQRLQEAGERFDTVILDPPKMARHRSGIKQALKGYHRLNQLAVEVLNPGGILVTCSCSGHVDRVDFEDMLAGVSLQTNRRLQILESRGQSIDHPTSVYCSETNYLKCAICRVE